LEYLLVIRTPSADLSPWILSRSIGFWKRCSPPAFSYGENMFL